MGGGGGGGGEGRGGGEEGGGGGGERHYVQLHAQYIGPCPLIALTPLAFCLAP